MFRASNTAGRLRLGWLGLPCLILLAGCSVSPGNRLIFFPEPNRLIDSARAVRQPAPETLAVPRELDKHVLPPYVVEPGDSLLVQAADLDSPVRLPADQPVLPDGTINLGRYGQLVIAGLTVPAIESAVQNLVAAQTPNAGRIVVRVVARQSKVYYVLGEVNAPGAFQLAGRETVLDGIIAAGGLNERASHHNIILSRPTGPDSCRVVLPVCYPEIVQLGDTTTNYQLAPGDRIYVPTREGMCHRHKPCPACEHCATPCDLTDSCADRFGASLGVPMPLPVYPGAPGVAGDQGEAPAGGAGTGAVSFGRQGVRLAAARDPSAGPWKPSGSPDAGRKGSTVIFMSDD